MNGYLGCFYFLALMNNVALNIHVQMYRAFFFFFFSFFGYPVAYGISWPGIRSEQECSHIPQPCAIMPDPLTHSAGLGIESESLVQQRCCQSHCAAAGTLHVWVFCLV